MSTSEKNLQTLTQDEYEQRRKVWETVKTLNKSEQEELFKILKFSNVEYTENTNGIFFDVAKLPDLVIQKIMKFLAFCAQNRVDFEERDKTMEHLRITS